MTPRDAGAGTVAAVGVAAAVVAMLLLVAPLAGVAIARHRAVVLADAAALAAASALTGLAPGEPCAAAAAIADRGGGELVACTADGLVATVAVSIPMIAGSVSVYASAGPPPAPVSERSAPVRPGILRRIEGADMV